MCKRQLPGKLAAEVLLQAASRARRFLVGDHSGPASFSERVGGGTSEATALERRQEQQVLLLPLSGLAAGGLAVPEADLEDLEMRSGHLLVLVAVFGTAGNQREGGSCPSFYSWWWGDHSRRWNSSVETFV
jgi:hypothetical protein